jgi:hypothetical protein
MECCICSISNESIAIKINDTYTGIIQEALRNVGHPLNVRVLGLSCLSTHCRNVFMMLWLVGTVVGLHGTVVGLHCVLVCLHCTVVGLHCTVVGLHCVFVCLHCTVVGPHCVLVCIHCTWVHTATHSRHLEAMTQL